MAMAESKVREILAHPLDYNGWTIQGLGMLRLHLNDQHTERLHIWDPNMVLNNVVSAHDHPWDLDATIYFGKMGNQRYSIGGKTGVPAQGSLVNCGLNSHFVGEVFQTTLLEEKGLELYVPGSSYHMEAEELHDSFPEPGTVTVINKGPRPERDVATIIWLGGGAWQEEGFTREATKDEILHFTGLVALKD